MAKMNHKEATEKAIEGFNFELPFFAIFIVAMGKKLSFPTNDEAPEPKSDYVVGIDDRASLNADTLTIIRKATQEVLEELNKKSNKEFVENLTAATVAYLLFTTENYPF
jgi:hypothetical protein